MKNFVQAGKTITVIAPYAVSSGMGVLVGVLFGVAAFDAAQGAAVEIAREGVFDVLAVTADTATPGTKVYWDNTARKLTTTVGSNPLVGATTAAKAGTDTTARVLLDGTFR